MDSKHVTKEINSIIRPFLKENGFDKYTGRTYWRYLSDRIDILNFQSFSSYHANKMGCTTFSFSVNLATFINYIPIGGDAQIKEKKGQKRPEEYQGHFRFHVKKDIGQKEFPEKNIWFIDNDGKYLTKAISDCKVQIEKNAFQWFKQFDNQENILRILLEDQIDMNGTWGFGNMESPNRYELIAYTALELGKLKLALENFSKLLISLEKQYFHNIEKIKRIKEEIKRIKTTHNKM